MDQIHTNCARPATCTAAAIQLLAHPGFCCCTLHDGEDDDDHGDGPDGAHRRCHNDNHDGGDGDAGAGAGGGVGGGGGGGHGDDDV